MSIAVAEDKVLVINPFLGGAKANDKQVAFDHCVVRDPRDKLPEGWTGFEVLTARDGGKRITWSRMNFEQITEAKQKFEELIAEGLVPYYIGDDGRPSEMVMDEFDPSAGAFEAEKSDFNPSRVVMAPTKMAVGG